MADRVRIFDRAGRALCDVRATAERAWLLNQEGEAEFEITTSNPACRADFLRFGNWVLIENDKLLPWVGMIDVPQEWGRRSVHVHAYTPERMFTYRRVNERYYVQGRVGNTYREVINLLNRAEPTIISAGNLWTGGENREKEKLTGDYLADYLQKLVDNTNGDYAFRPVVIGGRLTISADWLQRDGYATSQPLVESSNIEDADGMYKIDGQFANKLTGATNGMLRTAYVIDSDSISMYGLRDGTENFPEKDTRASVLATLRDSIKKRAWPSATFAFGVLDVGTTWSRLQLGYNYPLLMWSVGFGIRKTVRIESMYYDPRRGKVDCKATEVV